MEYLGEDMTRTNYMGDVAIGKPLHITLTVKSSAVVDRLVPSGARRLYGEWVTVASGNGETCGRGGTR